jgi:hypothetical protein
MYKQLCRIRRGSVQIVWSVTLTAWPEAMPPWFAADWWRVRSWHASCGHLLTIARGLRLRRHFEAHFHSPHLRRFLSVLWTSTRTSSPRHRRATGLRYPQPPFYRTTLFHVCDWPPGAILATTCISRTYSTFNCDAEYCIFHHAALQHPTRAATIPPTIHLGCRSGQARYRDH